MPELGERFRIRSIPTMAVFAGGREVGRTSGRAARRPTSRRSSRQSVSTAHKRRMIEAPRQPAGACRRCAARLRRVRRSSAIPFAAAAAIAALESHVAGAIGGVDAQAIARSARSLLRGAANSALAAACRRSAARPRPASTPASAQRGHRGYSSRHATGSCAARRSRASLTNGRAARDPARHAAHARARQPPEAVLHGRRSALGRHAVSGQRLPLARAGGDLRRGHPPAARRAYRAPTDPGRAT